MKVVKWMARILVRIVRAVLCRWRVLCFRATLDHVGRGCVFGSRIVVQGHEFIRLGDRVHINDQVVLQSGRGANLVLEDEVTLSFGAKILSAQYQLSLRGFDRMHHTQQSVVIEHGAWIGSNAVILPGICIGAKSVVGAGAVVTKNVPAGAMVAGVPAKVIRRLSADDENTDRSQMDPAGFAQS